MAINTTPTKKSRIVQLKSLGWTNKAVADKENINPSTVSRINARYSVTGNFYEKKPRTGRPRKLDDADVRNGIRKLSSGAARNATDLQKQEFQSVSVYTVRRSLKLAGLQARIRRKKPLLKPIHKRKRIRWAWDHSAWEKENWEAVVFSDESKFNLFGSDGRQWCWRRPGEEFRDVNTQKKVKHGGGSIMVWGAITHKGVGRLHRIEGTMDAKKYTAILQESLLGTLKDHHIKPKDIYFQQDNDPKHTSKLAQAWFKARRIDLLDWPPNSPDMNIIENLWNHLDRMVHSRNPLPQNLDELWTALQEEWGKIGVDFIGKLYGSLPQRVEDLRKAKGGATRY